MMHVNCRGIQTRSPIGAQQLNKDKCFYVSFTRKQESAQLHFNYTINGASITKVNLIRDLSVTFDSKFTFEPHITNVINKAYRTMVFSLVRCIISEMQKHTSHFTIHIYEAPQNIAPPFGVRIIRSILMLLSVFKENSLDSFSANFDIPTNSTL